MARRAIRAGLLVLGLASAGCSYVTSSTAGLNSVNGEAWYVRTTTFFGLPVGSSIWYCPPPGEGAGHPLCSEARLHAVGNRHEAMNNRRKPADSTASEGQLVYAGKKKAEDGEDDEEKENGGEEKKDDDASAADDEGDETEAADEGAEDDADDSE